MEQKKEEIQVKNVWTQLMLRIRLFFTEQEVLYIGGTDVLPPPLEKEKEQKCLLALSGVSGKEDYEDAKENAAFERCVDVKNC